MNSVARVLTMPLGLTSMLLLVPLAAGPSLADCVEPLATCVSQCTREFRPEHPDRPQCARGCISAHQRCERLEQLQSGTGGPIRNPGMANSPPQ